MIKEFFERLFCKHKYKIDVVKHKYTGNDGNSKEACTYFLECTKCGRRKVVPAGWMTYSSQTKELFRLWKRREIEVDFDEENKNEQENS